MLAKQLCLLLLATLCVPVLAANAAPPVTGTSRWATFDASGTNYFAVSVQADAASNLPLADKHEVVVLVDTSASQTGPVRIESMEAVEELLAGLPANSSIAIVACDVKAVPLTKGLVAAASPELDGALEQLKKRVPLGLTNLSLALTTAMSQFGASENAQRTIVYVGDGINRKEYLKTEAYKSLIEKLVSQHVTVTSFVIGPMIDVPALAALSNQTGGVLVVRNEITASMQEVGRMLAESVHSPVLWPTKVEKPAALVNHLPAQFPPLRLDRDTVIVGQTEGSAEAGKLVVEATSAGQSVTLRWNIKPEESHPDMAFLPKLCESATKDAGRTLPALGSEGLRAVSYVMFESSVAMVKAGEFALKSGELASARRIAEEALKADPNNAEAQSLMDAVTEATAQAEKPATPTGKLMSFMQDPQDPFATPETTEPPAGADPFGEPAAPTEPAAADPAAPAAATPAAADPLTPDISDAQAPVDAGVFDNRFFDTGDLLRDEQSVRDVAEQAIEMQVNAKLAAARRLLSTDPTAVKNSLMALLEELDQSASLSPGKRRTLDTRVRSQLEQTAEAEARYLDQQARQEAVRSQAAAAQRLLAESERRETSLKQLVESFTFLMSQGRYLEASQEIAPEIETLSPGTPLASQAFIESSLQANQALVNNAFRRREQGFIDAMRGVEEAAVPFDGVPPIVYPPADVWNALSARRQERYGSINLAADDNEQRIYEALRSPTEVDFVGQPLNTVMQTFEDKHGIDIYINDTELDTLGVTQDTPITLSLQSATLRSALRMMLKPLDLTYVIKEGTLQITSTDDANKDPVNKIYPVGDLVVPPMSMGGGMGGMGGGMGGMGGGMGGMGGMGGGMGGMGGMGGGMGGMGGGMGGMGGMGGGGGMFTVPDDAKKSTKPAVGAKPAPAKPQTATKAPVAKAPVAKPAAAVEKAPAEKAVAVAEKKIPENWNDLLSDYANADEKTKTQLDAEVREIVTSLVSTAQKAVEAKDEKTAIASFQRVVGLINQMLSSGHPQPWMYQALSLSMKACNYPKEDIERVMLSTLDFGGGTDAALDIAEYFAKNQMKAEALALLHDTSMVDPNSYQLYALALPLARELNDVDALRWTCAGVLSKAWPTRYDKLVEDAKLAARATSLRLKQAGKVVEGTVFDNEMKEALRRDIIVRVTWTGAAEIALRVKEPAGTICSYTNPITLSGGVLINASSQSKKESLDGVSEYYVCPKGFSGEYDILLRRIWGKVSGGKAVVEVVTDYGTPDQNIIVQEIDINEKDALIKVAVKSGHREEPIAAADLANIREKQLAAGRGILAQFAGGPGPGLPAGGSSSSYSGPRYNPYAAMQALLAASANNGFPFRGAVGYRPVIQTIPEGAFLTTSGVVSADRRYVQISPSPFFSQIGEVFTFNFVSGQTAGGSGTTGGTGNGAGGGAGGFGNGGGGNF